MATGKAVATFCRTLLPVVGLICWRADILSVLEISENVEFGEI
jgi:hypothetical protein